MRTAHLILLLVVLARFFGHGADCEWCSTVQLEKITKSPINGSKTFSWSQGEADTNRIDLLVAFDDSARLWIEKKGGNCFDFAYDAVNELNASLTLTGLDEHFVFNLKSTYDIGLDLSGYSIVNLCRYAWSNSVGKDISRNLKPLRDQRDEVRADIVVVIVNPQVSDANGASWELTEDKLTKSGMADFAERAYVICNVATVFPQYSMTHEIGHVLGAGHADMQMSSKGPLLKSYSSACYFSCNGEQYTTVMGYPQVDAAGRTVRTRLPFFSSPDYEYNGVPVGTVKNNDNTRTLRETYALVANFRVATPLPGYEEKPHEEEPGQQPEKGISVSVIRGADESVSEGQEVVLNRFVTDQFAVQATVPSSKKVTVKVSGLPTGMKYTSKTGLVSGFPKKAGRYTVKVSATCKGEEKKTVTFAVRVDDAPSWLVGDYVGLVTVDGVTSLATLKVSTAGKVSFKCKCGGRSRTFSCAGFASEETGAYTALPSAKISSIVRTFSICLENRSAALVGGRLLQKPWSRKDITAPKIRKTIKTTYGDLSVKISTKGKASFSGKVNGVRVSGSSQVVASFDGQGIAQLVLPIALDAKKNFSGIFEWVDVQLGESYAIINPKN